MSDARIGIDVGGTRLKLGLVRHGAVVARAVVALAPETQAPAALAAALASEVAALQARTGATVASVGLGIAGVLSADGERVLESPNLPWLDGATLPALLRQRLGVGVVADNDANCVGWGEAVAGAGAGVARQLCFALGTGLGGALVLDGQLMRGSRGRGVELGHLVVDPRGPPCGCGGRGCVEQYASKTGLLRLIALAGWRAMPGDDPIVALFAAARGGEGGAAAIVAAAMAGLAVVIARLWRLLAVDHVVLAGGIADAFDVLAPALEHALALRLGDAAAGLTLRQGTLGVDAGIIGAAMLERPGGDGGAR